MADKVVYELTVESCGYHHYIAVMEDSGFVALGASVNAEAARDAMGERRLREKGVEFDRIEHIGDFSAKRFIEILKGGER